MFLKTEPNGDKRMPMPGEKTDEEGFTRAATRHLIAIALAISALVLAIKSGFSAVPLIWLLGAWCVTTTASFVLKRFEKLSPGASWVFATFNTVYAYVAVAGITTYAKLIA